MKPNFLLTLSFLLLMGVLLIHCRPSQEKVKKKLTLKTVTIEEQSTQPKYFINISYPQIEALPDTAVTGNINRWLKSDVNQQLRDFKKDMQLSWQMDNTTLGELESNLKISYQTGVVYPDLVSLAMKISKFNAAAAYPVHMELSYTFDPKTGEEIDISQLFIKDSGYLQTLSGIASDEITNQKTADRLKPDASLIMAATRPQRQNFKTFLINEDYLSIYYYYYTVSGQREPDIWINIPYTELSKHIDKSGPLQFINNSKN